MYIKDEQVFKENKQVFEENKNDTGVSYFRLHSGVYYYDIANTL
jgi:hypothetical protein